jgi:hypothetical protein
MLSFWKVSTKSWKGDCSKKARFCSERDDVRGGSSDHKGGFAFVAAPSGYLVRAM